VIVLVRIEGVQLRTQVLERKKTDVNCRIAEVGVARLCDPETALPVTDERSRGWFGDIRAHSSSKHRQVPVRLFQPVRFVVVDAKFVVNL